MKSGAARAYFISARGLKDSESERDVLPAADLYPTWLLPVPQRLVLRQSIPCYHGELTLLAGPQRLETGWLDGEPALRDYYMARSPLVGLVWVYCERLGRSSAAEEAGQAVPWYLHGVYG